MTHSQSFVTNESFSPFRGGVHRQIAHIPFAITSVSVSHPAVDQLKLIHISMANNQTTLLLLIASIANQLCPLKVIDA